MVRKEDADFIGAYGEIAQTRNPLQILAFLFLIR